MENEVENEVEPVGGPKQILRSPTSETISPVIGDTAEGLDLGTGLHSLREFACVSPRGMGRGS